MHLGVNAIRLCRNFTGVGRYIECLLREWSQMQLPFDRVTLFTHTALEQQKLAFPLERFELRVIGKKLPDPVWETTWLRSAAADVDVLFGPSYTLPLALPGKCVVINHGPPENEPWSYQWFRAKAYGALYLASAHRADRLLASSESVKRRLIDVYRIPAAKIDVTYLAASALFHPVTDAGAQRAARAKYAIPDGPFILFVGKMARRHYIPNLIAAFARLRADTRVTHQLVLIGPDYLHLDIPRLARAANVEAHVTHVPYAQHQDLPALYSAAEFFVFPSSEAEGFGIPVLEAMACGTAVITTALGSLREVAVGAALTTNSAATAELHAAMQQLVFDPALRQKLVAQGSERAKQFSWPLTAQKTLDVLWSVAKS